MLLASWVEYDLNNINIRHNYGIENYGDWPGYDQSLTDVFCGDTCTQGTLLPRLAIVDEELHRVTAYHLLHELNEKRMEIAAYTNNFNLISSYNAEYDENMPLPEEPEPYHGETFESTAHNGGYGSVSGGMYNIQQSQDNGFKPFGAAGQGLATDLNVALDTSDIDRFMLVTVFTNDWEDQWEQNQELIDLTVGAYPFREIDFSVPEVPELTAERRSNNIQRGNFFSMDSDNAIAVSAGVAATLVLATLF